ncbi:hypothetical protein BDN72DRAFT_894533 [Pluteus cervinus]|uniref:Uncharacterized protein n=1 Tax=Pluteus cervinus TaxID=181527 RepID=A0ACD3B3S8_9AGAR|nr:hypothetical protein BDN72DRAFT_894533 [Pluteus cervinus]
MAPQTPRTYIFYGLNAVRAMSIISLILVFCSTVFVMANNIKAVNFFEANKGADDLMEDCEYIEGSTVPNQPAGVFWAIVSSLLIIFQTIALLLSEVRWPAAFFDRFFPVLGDGFGLGPLGIFQCLISTQILSHHVDDFTLVAAFLLFSIGCLNMLLGLIFRESAKERRSIRTWRDEQKTTLPVTQFDPVAFGGAAPRGFSEKASFDNASWKSTDKASLGFGRQGEKVAGLRGFTLQRPDETLPRYAPPPTNAKRSFSLRSSHSSFSSPPRSSRSSNRSSPSRAGTPQPVFKSSNTAL